MWSNVWLSERWRLEALRIGHGGLSALILTLRHSNELGAGSGKRVGSASGSRNVADDIEAMQAGRDVSGKVVQLGVQRAWNNPDLWRSMVLAAAMIWAGQCSASLGRLRRIRLYESHYGSSSSATDD